MHHSLYQATHSTNISDRRSAFEHRLRATFDDVSDTLTSGLTADPKG